MPCLAGFSEVSGGCLRVALRAWLFKLRRVTSLPPETQVNARPLQHLVLSMPHHPDHFESKDSSTI